MIKVFHQFAYNNLLANHRLLGAAEQLAEGEFEAARTGFFPSIQKTLNHIITVDWFYVDALEGGTLGAKACANEEPFDNPTALKAAQREVDFRLIELCAKLSADQLQENLTFHRFNEPIGNILSHLFQHQIHHRGQSHAMFAGTSVAPPQLDEFMFSSDHAARKSELAELDLKEEDLPTFR